MKKTVFVTVLAIMLAAAMVLTGCSTPAAEPSTSAPEASTEASTETSTEASAAESKEPDAQATQAVQVASTANDALIKAAKESGNVTIGMSIPQLANPYFVSVKNGVEAMCKEYGYELTVVDANYDVAKQVSDFENFMNQGVTAVISCPIDSNALIDVTQKMNEQGIIVISFAQLVPNANAIFTIDEYSYGHVIGENAAKWINEKLDGKGNVLIISQDNVESVVKRADGIQDKIMELCPDAVIVARQAGDNPEKGMQITEDVMQQHPEVNVITGNNDSGPLGAVEAVKGMNLSQDILDKFYIGGGDATPEAIEKMNDETSVYRATVDIGPYDTGENCVKAIHDIIESGVMPVGDAVKTTYFNMDPVWQEDVLAGWTAKGSES